MKPQFLIPLIIVTLLVGSIPTLLGSVFNRDNVESRYIPSGAMEPTLQVNDRVIVDKKKYKSQAPRRGEIIVFHPTKTLLEQDFKDDFIKRIIGLPGDRVELKEGKVYIGGVRLKEPYINNNDGTFVEVCSSEGGTAFLAKSVTIGQNQYLALGDNRSNSYDGRCWGTIDRDEIVGQATKIYWPFNRFGDIAVPSYSH
jgi:signal peptidase I